MTELSLERTIALPDMVAYAGATWAAFVALRDLVRHVKQH